MKRNIKKMILGFICLALLTGMFTACETIEEETEPTAAPTPTSEATVWEGEPTLSQEAKELLQFAAPVAGETVAEIIVENYGSMFVKFFPEQAPKAVDNFLTHAREGYYDNVTFHRVMEDFMIQGGDPEGTGRGGESIYGAPFEDEFHKELEVFRGALCMANAGADTNGSQFFLVQADAASVAELKALVEYQGYSFTEYLKAGYNTVMDEETVEMYLKYGGAPWLSGHHTVFGQMYEGFEVLDAIAATAVNSTSSKPLEDVVIKTIRVFEMP